MMLLKKISVCLCCLFPGFFFPQASYGFEIILTSDACKKGTAGLNITGTTTDNIINIVWSTGQQNVNSISDLNEGNYSISVSIGSSADTLVTDTTLNFSILKELCSVAVGNHFTPNGDGYNDVLQIVNVENHPNFEFEVFNKWGQRVHLQKSHYTPWDGKWAGAEVPDGTYFYVFFYSASDKHKLVKGDITILR